MTVVVLSSIITPEQTIQTVPFDITVAETSHSVLVSPQVKVHLLSNSHLGAAGAPIFSKMCVKR